MRPAVLALPVALATITLFGCAKRINDGGACFESSECDPGSVCAETVYGNFCMQQCSAEVVFCDDNQACLRSAAVSTGLGGAAGTGGEGGASGAGGAGGGAGGIAGGGGIGGESGEALWVCLPGGDQLQTDEIRGAAEFGEQCDYSLECERGGVCVCIPGAICSGEGRNGPTCQRVCDPTEVNQCPGINDIRPACTDLGDGRGFCDPTTIGSSQ